VTSPTPVKPAQAARRYDLVAPWYGMNAWLGAGVAREAIERAQVRPGERVLELGVGTGRDLIALARRVGGAPDGTVLGLDQARGMVRRARRRIAHGDAIHLIRGDAGRIPARSASWDLVFMSRVLDLMDADQIPVVLGECRRVLRIGGRLVLVNMSKPDERLTLFERLYARGWGFGGGLFLSRPVLAAPFVRAAGFTDVERVYRRGFPMGSEIILARRPS
jgi:ubiquinone/menaquinone biosynthesis C-methylase UbiE